MELKVVKNVLKEPIKIQAAQRIVFELLYFSIVYKKEGAKGKFVYLV